MDRRLKERLIGASLLALVVVLIVPELLSGPAPAPKAADAPDATRNITVDLTTRKPAAPPVAAPGDDAGTASGNPNAPASGVSLPPPAHTPPSVVTMPPAVPPSSSSATGHGAAGHGGTERPLAASRKAEGAGSLESNAAPPTSQAGSPSGTSRTAHGWAVQLGLFASRANADRLAHELKSQGFAAYVAAAGSASSPRYRVRVGTFADRDAAAAMQTKLKSQGHSGSLAPPGS